jgi:ABC-type transporter Mla subunit MlaD
VALPEDERTLYRAKHHRRRPRLPAWLIGLLLLIAAIAGPYLAFQRHVPFTDRGYELSAVFTDSLQIASGSPVRVAGVNVGEVLGAEREGEHTRVRFYVDESALPITEDAKAKLRPRMFFEGNWFLDLDPGSPSAPELEEGETIPVTRTRVAVQLDEVLNALQSDVRQDLADVLVEYGKALNREPTAADDRTFERFVHGKTGGEALNLAFRYGGDAGRASAQVLEALRGRRPDDLSKLVSGAARTFDGLAGREEDLRKLIDTWEGFTAALADESDNLARTFAELAPTLEVSETSLKNLSDSLPALRAWARELEPSLRELPGTIDAALPWLDQARPLIGEDEAGGSIRLLRRATPGLAATARFGLGTLRQIDLLSRCTSEVLVPTANQVITDEFSTGEPNYREFFYATANLAGEGSNFDGNGPFIGLMPAIGDVLVRSPNPTGNQFGDPDDEAFAHTTLPPKGNQPQLGAMPPFKPRVACHTQTPPDLNSGLGQPGPPSPEPVGP